MRGAALRIGGDEYPLTEVTVSAHDSEEDDEHFLMVNLFAGTEDLSKAGFAINSITWPSGQSKNCRVCGCIRSSLAAAGGPSPRSSEAAAAACPTPAWS